MKPFDINIVREGLSKLKGGEGFPVQTRSGETGKIFAILEQSRYQPILFAFDNSGVIARYHLDGCYLLDNSSRDSIDSRDLVLLPTKKTYWYAIYKCAEGVRITDIEDYKENAVIMALNVGGQILEIRSIEVEE